jgi:hypothetical protein
MERPYKLGPPIFSRLNPFRLLLLAGEGCAQLARDVFNFLRGRSEKDNYL